MHHVINPSMPSPLLSVLQATKVQRPGNEAKSAYGNALMVVMLHLLRISGGHRGEWYHHWSV